VDNNSSPTECRGTGGVWYPDGGSIAILADGKVQVSGSAWDACMLGTIAEDAFWGAVGNSALLVVGPTVMMTAAGSELGPAGAAAGGGLGLTIGVAGAPEAAAGGAWLGALGGVFHGLIKCSL
jgi:hypothetical protein